MSSIKDRFTNDLKDFKNGFFSNPFNFKNRASRKEFLTVLVVYLLYGKIISAINYEAASFFTLGMIILTSLFIQLGTSNNYCP